MTQGKWGLIHNFLTLMETDAGILAIMFREYDHIRFVFLALALLFLIIDTVADPIVKDKLRDKGRFIDFENVPMEWDLKGIITRLVGGVVVLTAMIAFFISPERPITNNIQVLSMDVMASPWLRIGAMVAFSVYFMYIAYESYCRNYSSERRKKSEDGYMVREWEE